MKKLFLFLILGVFLISFISATVTVSTNSTRPVFYATLTPDDGTNQLEDNTNYYFQCFIGGYGYEGMSVSPASEEFNVTTNSTYRWMNISNIQNMCNSYTINSSYKGVHCRWSPNRSFKDWGGSGYLPGSFSNNETASYTYWTEKVGNPGGYFAYNMRCSKGIDVQTMDSLIMVATTARSGYYEFHPEIAIALSERNRLNASYNIYKGTADVNIVDSSTWDDLVNAFIDSGNGDIMSSTFDSITILGQIYGTGAITFDGKAITIIGGDNDDVNLNFTKQSTLNLMYEQSQVWQAVKGRFHDSTLKVWGNQILSSIVESSNLYYINMVGSATHYTPTDGWTFNTKTPNSYHSHRYFANWTVSNDIWNKVYDSPVIGNYQNTYDSITYENDTWNNVEPLYYGGTYQVKLDTGYIRNNCNNTVVVNFINSKTTGNSYSPVIRVLVSWDMTVAIDCGTTLNATSFVDTKIKVIDENGNPIPNATITLSGYNDLIGQTNSNGIATLRVINYYYEYNRSDTPLYMTYFDTGNYTLTINKSGYSTYNTSVYIDQQKDWTIALESRDWNYSNKLEWMIRNSTNTFLKLDEFGNLAIRGKLYENTNSSFISNLQDVVFKIPNFLALTRDGNLYLVKELFEVIIP